MCFTFDAFTTELPTWQLVNFIRVTLQAYVSEMQTRKLIVKLAPWTDEDYPATRNNTWSNCSLRVQFSLIQSRFFFFTKKNPFLQFSQEVKEFSVWNFFLYFSKKHPISFIYFRRKSVGNSSKEFWVSRPLKRCYYDCLGPGVCSIDILF